MSTAQTGGLEQTIEKFHGVSTRVKDLPEIPASTSLISNLDEAAKNYYHTHKDRTTGILTFGDERKVKEFADMLWDKAADHIGYHLLKRDKEGRERTDGEIKSLMDSLKAGTDASGKNNWENFIKEQIGIEKKQFYEAVKTRKTLKADEVTPLIRQIYDTHLNATATKIFGAEIDDNEKAQAALRYLGFLKQAAPKTLEGVQIPRTFGSVQEVQALYNTVLQALPRDYKGFLDQAKTYAMKHKN